MARAFKNKRGKWQIQAYGGMDPEGKRILKTFYGNTRREAEDKAAEFESSRRRAKGLVTVGAAIDKYIELKRNVLSPSTIHGYEAIRAHRFPHLMLMDIQDVDTIAVQEAVNEDAERLTGKSIRDSLNLVKSALKLYGVRPLLNITLPPIKPKFKEIPTALQVMSIIRGSDIELPCMLAIWLSLRMSEVRGLQFNDLHGNVLTVCRSKLLIGGETVVRDVNKTYLSTRRLALPPFLVDLIMAVPHETPDDFIVPLSYQVISRRLKKLAAKNGFTMTFHDLRHLNASIMLALNIPDKYAMERGGWATNSTLKAVYQHTFSEERKKVDAKIDEYFLGLVQAVDNENQAGEIHEET